MDYFVVVVVVPKAYLYKIKQKRDKHVYLNNIVGLCDITYIVTPLEQARKHTS